MSTELNIVTAHSLEAHPLVGCFGLRQVQASPAIYISKTGTDGLRLIVAGEGQQCARDAVNYLAGLNEPKAVQAWLNVGIAGHQSRTPGHCMLASKIVNRSSGEAVYPALILRTQQHYGELHTVDEPELDYPDNVAYDMEAYAFFSAASAISSIELIQCLKIISDNRDYGVDALTTTRIRLLIASCLSEIRAVVAGLLSIQRQLCTWQDRPHTYGIFEQVVHLTATQQVQLLRLCQRYHALGKQPYLDRLAGSAELATMDGRSLINRLQSGLAAAEQG